MVEVNEREQIGEMMEVMNFVIVVVFFLLFILLKNYPGKLLRLLPSTIWKKFGKLQPFQQETVLDLIAIGLSPLFIYLIGLSWYQAVRGFKYAIPCCLLFFLGLSGFILFNILYYGCKLLGKL